MSKTIYLLVGPSGSGKTTLAQYLKELGIPELISTTTRKPCPGEVEGVTYYFVSGEQFAEIPMIEETEYNNNLYGTSKAEIERVLSQNDRCFAIVDAHGVRAYREIYGDICKVIYIHAPFYVLVERMKSRGDSPEVVAERVKHTLDSNELYNIDLADCCVVNLDLSEAKRQLFWIVGD